MKIPGHAPAFWCYGINCIETLDFASLFFFLRGDIEWEYVGIPKSEYHCMQREWMYEKPKPMWEFASRYCSRTFSDHLIFPPLKLPSIIVGKSESVALGCLIWPHSQPFLAILLIWNQVTPILEHNNTLLLLIEINHWHGQLQKTCLQNCDRWDQRPLDWSEAQVPVIEANYTHVGNLGREIPISITFLRL